MATFNFRKAGTALAAVTALSLTLTACGGESEPAATNGGDGEAVDTSAASGQIDYWLWDNNQKPAYEQCAADFQEETGVSVTITQYAWDDYWSGITNGFVAGTAPDVFTNHLSRYPEFVTQGQLMALDATLEADGVDVDGYQEGLADLWVGQDGLRYGLPKDFDTVAIFYNKALIEEAGVDEADLAALEWNPEDGGTYEEMIAHLTIDNNGVRGDEPGFDKTKVAVYGLGLDGGSGGGNGQTQWSMYSGTTGWTVTDKNPWGTKYNYDAAEFKDTISWMASLAEKGYMPTVEAVTGQSSGDIFGAGKYAMITNGSWMINQMFGYTGIETGLAPTPVGPSGERASMYNGLADSVWAGSDNKAAAVKWVEYLGSAACQDIVGEAGVVFPAIPSATEKAQAAFADRGIDVEPFLVHVNEGTTFLFPITDYASQINGIMQPAVDAVFTGQADVDSLDAANEQVNALFNG
ncbi:ABC transporter substrate-binding protein [Tessaracoccus lapidicaptus]|uniref:ABC transporter substrate-binding protein n=1 Tax=Tessaracoccus lapidicaptus TaxID=1427523 RepID=A0A1C0ARE4_9ACTN|nr:MULTISPECIES: sugar ABC transporter substrate-binding protein [Tessaracoccus]AQX16190.1 ABC transporter substrate-binding protein [Tessaracoccus sp. T2.5-30]OCL36937.1 ABC transporter substrate-binding protein [Tessaracoccus lapidicaptus]VEP40767.1 Maltodextrin-binding protein MdxE [Tessaracoccus lapidicaptus]